MKSFVCIAVTFFSIISLQANPYNQPDAFLFSLDRVKSEAPKTKAVLMKVEQCPFTGADALKVQSSGNEELFRLQGTIPWREEKVLAMDVYYNSEHAGMMQLRFYVKNEKQPRLTSSISLFPKLRTRVTFGLTLLNAQEVFMPRNPGRLKGVISGRRLLASELDYVAFSLENTGDQQEMYISNLALLSSEPECVLPDQAVVDALGQYKLKDWPGKNRDEASLKQQLTDAFAAAQKAAFPSEWSQYGGWKSKKFKATGFFRKEHDGRRWWLVDPEGYGFFSAGLDCVSPGESVAILPGMEKLFEWLPSRNGPFAEAYGRSFRGGNSFDFALANLIRVFGSDWKEKWPVLAVGRLKQWRFNTIANWSRLDLLQNQQFPYVLQLNRYPSTTTTLFRDFPDVYSPAYQNASEQFARGLESRKDDPYMIGYFLRNEPIWAFGKNNLASEMLEANPGTASRKALSRWLSAKYTNDVAAWSTAWAYPFKSFEELHTGIFHRLAEASNKASEDLWAFSHQMVHEYVRIPCEAVKKIDPNHLNLGMRYAWISSDLLYSAGEYFDVYSINCYQMVPSMDDINTIAKRSGKPVMIGEFHFGALDRGLPATGLRGVASQAERGVAYRRYIETGAANPNLVGAHYFILNDQALLGRFDGENYQIGFVDCCNTPYRELVEQATITHENIYRVMSGEQKPFNTPAKETPKVK